MKDFFSEEQKKEIRLAIQAAETNTSGEIRVHLEGHCKGDVLDRATDIFAMLKMHKTELRNGVLFYLAVEDHQFAILGDAGINQKAPDDFWDQIRNTCIAYFKEGKYSEGLVKGITMAGDQLKKHFPYSSDDKNELPDDISFGDKSTK